MLSRQQLKAGAKQLFFKRYWPIVGISALFMAILAGAGALSSIPYFGWVGISAAVFLGTPVMLVGYSRFWLNVYSEKELSIPTLFSGFKNFGHNLGGMLWMELFTFLWTLLFIVPGIVKAYAYMMTPYILADRPDVSATDALKLSMAMTDGHKGELFVASLSFLGWQILNALTCGVLGVFYVNPYMQTTFAGYYYQLSAELGRKQQEAAKAAEQPTA